MSILEVEARGRVRVLHLNRPEKRNALSGVLADAIEAALREGDRDPAVGAMVLAGRGPTFSAGADLAEFLELARLDPAGLYERGRTGLGLFGLQAELQTPVVAAARGHVLAGGVGLLLVAHLAVGADDLVLGLPEIRRGLFPYTVLPLLARAVGERRAMALALSGRTISADTALDWGLVDAVVPAEQVLDRAMEEAERLAAVDPVVIRSAMEAYRALGAGALQPRLAHLALLRNLALSAPGLAAAAEAFLSGSAATSAHAGGEAKGSRP